ncbi:MAG: HPr family phosphocarrier protein [Clostridia bacterium]|nr:HPr family phosphocarrier protein [Clostridia bacterium]MBP5293817.1 HPr family phosphocarrier protein [Clostridia bacterium]
MKTKNIRLVTIQDVQDLVRILINFNGDVDLISGRYIVDGKSLLGIFSLDMMKPIQVKVHDDKNADALFKAIERFIVD